MGYTKLVFVAARWQQLLDEATQTMTLRAMPGEGKLCELSIEAIPGTDPVEYEYHCKPMDCDGRCELQARTQPDGSVEFWCECVPGGMKASGAVTGEAATAAAPVISGARRKKAN